MDSNKVSRCEKFYLLTELSTDFVDNKIVNDSVIFNDKSNFPG